MISFAEHDSNTIHKMTLACLLNDMAAETVDRLAREGKLVRAERRGYFLMRESLQTYIAHLQEAAAGRKSEDGRHGVAAELAQLKAAQRQLVEMKIAQMRGDTISVAETELLWGTLVRDVRSMILSLPVRAKGELPHLLPSEIEVLKRVARQMLTELRDLGDQPPLPSPKV